MDKNIIIKNLLEKGVSNVIDRKSLEKKLNSGKKLKIKFGIDPTGTQVHIGHAVPILKLREFQKLGHEVIILIGDSTAQVGDTSDKNAERPMLTREETRKNAKDYINQFGKILDISKVRVYYNSDGLDKVNFNGVGELAKHFSVAEMLDRDSFSKRFKNGIRISLQEFLYPIMQGYDSYCLEADVELGGNDQYFNLLAGRKIQKALGQEKQDIITFNLIEGTDGRKMSKTYKNFIGLDFSHTDMFVKIMEIKDELILSYFEHCTGLYLNEIEIYKKRLNDGENPKNVKIDLAREIVTLYHSKEKALKAEKYFERVLKKGMIPDEKDIEKTKIEEKEIQLVTLLRKIGMVNTSTEGRNAISSNGVKVNNELQDNPNSIIKLDKKDYILVQVGKKKFKMVK